KLDDGGPVLYVQDRVGKDGRTFRCYKFRTMVVNAEKIGLGLEVARNDPRITRVGRFLRQWTLDELPQIINILNGDMSIVGPRPAFPSQVGQYTPRQRRRLEVKPGMAGWAIVNGRNSITWAERIEHDVWYVDNWSLWLDFLIIVKSFLAVIRRQGIYGPDGMVRDLE
ncbi:MAG: sugar transferase, partial [Chloroflexi bacterium]|nr:sugar transferase [Chloroflexota bacterium]